MNERDKTAQMMQDSAGNSWGTEAHFQAFAALIRADEREACAVLVEKTICDTHIPTGINIYGTRAAKALRAVRSRGNK